MSARLIFLILSLEEAKRTDDLQKRREATQIRMLSTLHRNIDYIKHFRLSEELIDMLQVDLEPYLPPKRSPKALSNRLKILYTLSFLANGGYQKPIGRGIQTFLSQSSASRVIHQVVNALNAADIVRKYVRFPQNRNERQVLKESFFEKFKIPGVIGCVDGTLVAMVKPRENEERYFCRKGYHARNVLIINDADLNIIHVDVTFGGATHDSFVFTNSVIRTHLETLYNNGEVAYLLGDSGYPQRPYLMTPFRNPIAGTPQEFYNKIQSTARSSVERTIGVLKGRFRCLLSHNALQYDSLTVGKIVVAACVLHNICNRAGLPAPGLDSSDMEAENLLSTMRERQLVHHTLENGRQCRQNLVDQLWRANIN